MQQETNDTVSAIGSNHFHAVVGHKLRGRWMFVWVAVLGMLGSLAQAATTPIELNATNFFADPTVTFAPDGSSAEITEDAGFSAVLVANDPGLGDPVVVIAGTDVSLVFEYDFVEGGPGNVDEFGAFIVDSSGFSAGAAFEIFRADSDSGTVSFDLSSLLSEPFIGVQFQLASLPGDLLFDSVVTISNLRLESPGQVIPLPAAAWMGMTVLGGIVLNRIRRTPV